MEKYLDKDGLAYFKGKMLTQVATLLTEKLDVNQGTENVGKFLRVDSTGNIALETIANATGVSF